MVDKEYFDGVLEFDFDSGVLKWKSSRSGCKNKTARKSIKVDGILFPAQRVAWLIHYGEWPKGVLRHFKYGSLNPYDMNIKNYIDDTSTAYRGMFK